MSLLYTLLANEPHADIFSDLADAKWKDMRKLIINCIIHTDMVHHFPMVSKVSHEEYLMKDAESEENRCAGRKEITSTLPSQDSACLGGCQIRIWCPSLQLEVFQELNAAAISGSIRAADSGLASPAGPGPGPEAGGAQQGPEVWKTPEDRQFLLALLLHCADISNAVKPFSIAEKCADLLPVPTQPS